MCMPSRGLHVSDLDDLAYHAWHLRCMGHPAPAMLKLCMPDQPPFLAPTGAKVAVCELPFEFISSDTAGGVGGTCVLRGCVPKKLMVYASEFNVGFKDAEGFG
jgi:hypothetical protein